MEILLRSMLFVPANNPLYIKKALSSAADAIIFDLEDAVPKNGKAAARGEIAAFIESIGIADRPVFVRTNEPDSAEIMKDIAACMHPNLNGFVIPKVSSADDIVFIDKILTIKEREKGFEAGHFRLIPMIENTTALMNLPLIASGSPRIIALAFGAYDYSHDLRLMSDDRSKFHLMPRALVAAAARSVGVQPIDTPFFTVKDIDGLRREKEEAFALGFSGSMVITPRHIEIVNECFTPSAEKIAYAKGVLKAIEEGSNSGTAAVLYDGMMVDAPIENLSRQIAAYADMVSAQVF